MEKDGMKYSHNVLEGFGNGCLTDYRVRIALNLLATSPMFGGDWVGTPAQAATQALDVAAEVMAQAEVRGWVAPIPDDAELNAPLRKQARRTAQYQVLQQIEGQKVAKEEADRVVPSGVVRGLNG